MLRSVLACAFPLFTPAMFTLGDAEAMSIFAGLCTLCMPIPILFYVRTLLETVGAVMLTLCIEIWP